MIRTFLKKSYYLPGRIYLFVVIIIIAGISFGFMVRSYFSRETSKPRIIKTCEGHFTGPNELNRIVIYNPVKGNIDSNYIEIFQLQGKNQVRLWTSPPAPIWDIFLADVDGDRCDELALCLYKVEIRDPKKDNRLHIYNWRDGSVYARWRGTFLSKPFEMIAFGNITGDNAEELISIERGRKNPEKIFLCVYQWNGFGFDLFTETQINSMPEKVIITDHDNNDYNEIKLFEDNSTLCYHLVNDSLEKER